MEVIADYIPWPPAYKIRKHRRARHVKLRTSRQHGLEITVPYRFNEKELPSILEEHKAWIIKQLEKRQLETTDELPLAADFPTLQESWTIQYMSSNKRLTLLSSPLKVLSVVGNLQDKTLLRDKLKDWVRVKARECLPDMLNRVSQQIQIGYEDINIRDQKTQWGSCSASKTINLNYRLIFLPETLARHIMVHELCHTVHLNHSKRFWALVAKHDPAWMENRRALRHADQHVPAWL